MNRQTTRSRGRPPTNSCATRTSTRLITNPQQNQSITSFFGKRQEDVKCQDRSQSPQKNKESSKNDSKVGQELKSVNNTKRLSQKCNKNSQNGFVNGAHHTTKQVNQEEFELISGSEKENLPVQIKGSQMELRGSTNKRESKPIHFTDTLDEHPSIREEHVELKEKEDKKKNTQDVQSELVHTQQNGTVNSERNIHSSPMNLRQKKKRDYKQMLEGDENYLKTIEDEKKEIQEGNREARDQMENQYSQYYINESGAKPRRYRLSQKNEEGIYGSDYEAKIEKRMRQGMSAEEALKNVEDDNESLYKYPGKAADQDFDEDEERVPKRRQGKTSTKKGTADIENETIDQAVKKQEDIEEAVFIDNLPKDSVSLRNMIKRVNVNIRELEQQFFEEEDSDMENELKDASEETSIERHNDRLNQFKDRSYIQQFWSIPLSDSVIDFNWNNLAQQQRKNSGQLFDVITCDPPWTLSNANPTRGVAIAYSTLSDKEIMQIPFDKIQDNGFLFIWVINAKYRFAIQLMEQYGYTLVDEVTWVKQTINGKIAKGHGYYLQHAKETCLIGAKGNVLSQDWKCPSNMTDLIFSQRRGQSQKPEEIYEIAESMIPNGYYLEIFGRRNNLHNGWVTIGNEL